MKSKEKKSRCFKKTAVVVSIISIIFIIISSLSLYYFDEILDKQIAKVRLSNLLLLFYLINFHFQQLPIRPNTEAFEKWQKIAVPLTIKFFLFNVTNAFEVINFGGI